MEEVTEETEEVTEETEDVRKETEKVKKEVLCSPTNRNSLMFIKRNSDQRPHPPTHTLLSVFYIFKRTISPTLCCFHPTQTWLGP